MGQPYESTTYLREYLLFHYGKPRQLCSWPGVPKEEFDFHARLIREMTPGARGRRALDLGCAVGRVCFELSRRFEEVIGIDNSRSFIAAANRLKRARSMQVERREEGGISSRVRIRPPAGSRPGRIRFATGDAQRLPASLGVFDLVTAINLLCRLPDPGRLLRRLPELVRKGGMLLISTPCSWLEEFTPRSKWLSGRQGTFRALKRILGPDFKLLRRRDFPFLIRQHRRKYEWVISEASSWLRK